MDFTIDQMTNTIHDKIVNIIIFRHDITDKVLYLKYLHCKIYCIYFNP